MLVETTKGLEVGIMQKVVYAYILLILTYGISIWWLKQTQINHERQTIQNSIENNCKKLEKFKT